MSHDECTVPSWGCQSHTSSNGRVDQKRRTRDALDRRGPRSSWPKGETPTVEAAAEAASISRTTAYRYFPNQRALLVAAHPETARHVAAARRRTRRRRRRGSTSSSTRSRARSSTTRRSSARCFDSRSKPTRSSAPQLPLRQGRAIKWIEEALAPLAQAMSDAEIHRLAPRDTKRHRDRSARVADRRRRAVARRARPSSCAGRRGAAAAALAEPA